MFIIVEYYQQFATLSFRATHVMFTSAGPRVCKRGKAPQAARLGGGKQLKK